MSARSIYEDGTYAAHNPTWHAEDSRWKATHIRALLERNDVHPTTVCEVGCGAGGILNALADDLGPTVQFTGFDVAPDAIARCVQRPNIKFVCGDALDDPATFDVALAIDVFEHVEDYLGFLHGLRSKGAHHVFHIPLDLSVQSVLRATPLQHNRDRVGHLHAFTKETALATLEHAGYTILDHAFTYASLDRPSRSWRASLMKGPRRLLSALHADLAVRILGGASLLVLAR